MSVQARSATNGVPLLRKAELTPRDVQDQGYDAVVQDIMQQYKRSAGHAVSQCMHVSMFIATQSSHAQCMAMTRYSMMQRLAAYIIYM